MGIKAPQNNFPSAFAESAEAARRRRTGFDAGGNTDRLLR